MKKHYFFFALPVSPVVNFWSISGVQLPSDGSDAKDPVALSNDDVVSLTGASLQDFSSSPVLPYDRFALAIRSLSLRGSKVVDVRPFQNGGVSIEVIVDSDHA